MTQDEIMQMAREARWSGIYSQWISPTERQHLTVPVTIEQIETFANLVAAKEREECAKICDEYSATGKIEEFDRGWLACAKNVANAIRARKQA